MKRVAIIGGGISGLCAAHELLENGFAVDIYERNDLPGGKARSFDVPSQDHQPSKGRKNLPAEHGFRFFPGFYRHLDETMEKIRYSTNTNVRDILLGIDQMNYARFGKDVISMPTGSPDTHKGLLAMLKKWLSRDKVGMPLRDLLKYWLRLGRFFASCDERIHEEYEHISWWDFLRANGTSEHYRRYFASSSRILVAADPVKASTKTNGIITEQFIFDLREKVADRVLPGPTNQTWLFPWLYQLQGLPTLRFFFNAEVSEVLVDAAAGEVSGLVINHRGTGEGEKFSRLVGADLKTGPVLQPESLPQDPVTADYYLCATPVEVTARYLKKNDNWTDLAQADPSLQRIVELQQHTQWMTGVVFYLTGDITALQAQTLNGHSVYIDTPFALTSLFQERHWDSTDFPMSDFGQGDLTGICSVCVSNWNDTKPDSEQLPNGGKGRIYGQSAQKTIENGGDFAAGKEKLIEELWADLKESLTVNGNPVLDDSNLLHWHIDPAIQMVDGKVVNSEPLLVNRVNSWHLRPDTATAVPNFLLCGDYVRTNTDLATMEAACESGLRASNAILDAEHRPASEKRKIHALRRLSEFAPLRYIDRLLYRLQS